MFFRFSAFPTLYVLGIETAFATAHLQSVILGRGIADPFHGFVSSTSRDMACIALFNLIKTGAAAIVKTIFQVRLAAVCFNITR